MRARQAVPASLLRLADLQSGVVDREQLTGCGVSRHSTARLLAEGRWQRLGQGLFFVHDTIPEWSAWAWAGVLAGGPRARVGGSGAAHLHGLSPTAQLPIRVLVPVGEQTRLQGPWDFRRERPGARSPRSPGSPPRTTVEDTVLDLCDDGTPEQVVDWLTGAVQKRMTTPQRLRDAARDRSRLRHRALVAAVLSDVAGGAQTPLELAYLRDVERAHGLPRGRRQANRRRYWSDVSYDDYGLLVELDGRIGHEEVWRDLERDNAFALDARLTLRYGWRDVTGRPCRVALQVGQVLSARGWNEALTRCPRCACIGSWSDLL